VAVDPQNALQRSPVYRGLPAYGSVAWTELAGGAVAERVGTAGLGALAIVDLSPLPRLGFKGRETLAAMQARGVTVENRPNRAFRQPDGGLCLVLAASEVMLLAPLSGDGARLAALEVEWRIDAGVRTYPLPRRDSHAWFAVAGRAASAMFAKLCGVDLRLAQFPDLAIAQTSVARLNAVVVRADEGGEPVFHLLADSAAAIYLLDCLVDAADEFGGRVAGRDVLSALSTGEHG
jgi:sarcosine oxidase subunit gamma